MKKYDDGLGLVFAHDDTTEDVMNVVRIPRSSQEVDRCATRRRDPQAEGTRRRPERREPARREAP